jgi:hypothetical protein
MSRIVMLAKTNRKEFKRFSKFLVVGITGFVVDFGVFNLLLRALNFPQRLLKFVARSLPVCPLRHRPELDRAPAPRTTLPQP